jgi:hypothetical protein
MDDNANSSAFNLRPNLIRRVENFSLAASVPSNALVPIYEAIYNSLHSLHERFGADEWYDRGFVEVTKYHDDKSRLCFSIRDNGAGLTKKNFDSFLTYDSDLKRRIGGKRIGRLSWLKVFEAAKIESHFVDNGTVMHRTFDFALDNDIPVQNHHLREADDERIETSVYLVGMKPSYAAHMPSRPHTVASKIVAHFLSFLIGDHIARIVYNGDGETIDIRELLSQKEMTLGENRFHAGDEEVEISHTLLERSVSESGPSHKLFYAANGRIVLERDISLPLGISTYIERSGSRYVYYGIVSGALFDSNVNTERTNFDLDRTQFEEIHTRAIAFARENLSQDVEKVVSRQTDLVRGVLKKFPRYAYLVSDARQFAEVRIPRSMNKAEQVYQQLALYDFRENRRIERDVESITKRADVDEVTEEIASKSSEIINRLTQQEFSALADYTAKRKIILDLLQRRLGYKPDGEMRRYSEEAIHSIVCPVRVTTRDVDVDQHNLWVIDDKLTYYEFWASDKRIKEYVSGSDSDKRPDIALFSGQTLFRRPGSNQPIVVIEFKRPAREAYDYEENPIMQTFEYIDALRGARVVDKSGQLIDNVGDDQPFFCYVIADFTKNLRKYLDATQINTPLPGGAGYYGFNRSYNAFFQVLNYRYLVEDARMRNEAFFKRLKI